MGKDYDEDYFRAILSECEKLCFKKTPSVKPSHRQGFVEACEVFHDAFQSAKNATSEEELNQAGKTQEKAMKKCVKAASKIFEKLDLLEYPPLLSSMMKGAIIVKANPAKLAEFCSQDRKNGKLLDHLFIETSLMKEMLTNGGAKGGNYAQAMHIYTEILATFPDYQDEFTEINKKIALAVALELAEPINEFDTKIPVDPIKRYIHYRDAFKNGELDPAFPHFSVWELRHVVNCDATDDQLKWGRDMLMNYAPYISVVTDVKEKYLYILQTDVLIRNPSWTGSPRTYQQVLSGGGKDGPNAWFGRFICKAFGIPTWGCSQAGKSGLTRWTSEGWVACNGTTWDGCEWDGITGHDFKGEVDARASVSEEEYFNKFVLLECLAEVMDARRGTIPDEERTILHPLRTWRSLSIIQKALMLEPASPEKFTREGPSPVTTNQEKYLEMFELDKPDDEIKNKKGKVTIPVAASASQFGNLMMIASFKGGKQINFAGSGHVDIDLPVDVKSKTYKLTAEVNTVHLKQGPTFVQVDDGEPVPISIPYTVGEWKITDPVEIEVGGGQTLTFRREKGNLGLAIRRIYLE